MSILTYFKKKLKMKIPEDLDLRDFSDKRECYCSCPKCGSNNLGFGTTLDLIAYVTQHKTEYISSITCLSCLFRLATTEAQAREKHISIHELNRRNWNALHQKNKQNQQ